MTKCDEPSPGDHPVVLVVDHDQGMLELYSAALEPEHEVLMTTSGHAAIDIVRYRRVDAVLLDVLLPGMDGFDVLTRLRALDSTLRVILVTTLSHTAAVVRGTQLGAFDYVTKPFDSVYLALLVAAAVRERRANRGAILIVGTDLSSLASLAVFLTRYVDVATAAPTLAALPDPTQHSPVLVVYDGVRPSSRDIHFIERLHERFPRSKLIVLTTEPLRICLESQPDALRLYTIFSKSHGFDDVLQRIAVLTPGLEKLAVLSSRLRPHVLMLVNVVACSYQRSLSAVDLARAVRLSIDRLGHVVRDRLDMPLMEYVARFRFEVARHLLAVTASSLEDIASETGFSSASHLSRVFLKHAGLRPGKYRTRLRNNGMWPPRFVRHPCAINDPAQDSDRRWASFSIRR